MKISLPPRHFLRTLASVAVGNYVMLGLSAVVGIVVARQLGAENFGRLAVVMAGVEILAAVVFGWSHPGLVTVGAQQFARTGSVAETFWARAVFVAPWLPAFLIALGLWQHQVAAYLDVSVGVVWLALAYLVVSELLVGMGAVFQATQRMNRYAVALTLEKAALLALLWLIPAAQRKDVAPVVACYLASSLVVITWAVVSVGPRTLAPCWPSRSAVADLWKFSSPYLVSGLVALVGGQALLLAILKQYHAMGEVGVYSLATQITGVLQQTSVIVALVLLPRVSVMVSRRRDDDVSMLVEHVSPFGLLAVAMLLSACALIGKATIPWVFGPAFTDAVPVLMILIVGAMASTFYALFQPFFNAYGLTWTMSAVSVTTSIVKAVAGFILVPRYGAHGAAAATVLSFATAAVLILYAVSRRFRVRALRFAWLGLPVIAVSVSTLLLEGKVAYWVAAAAAGVSLCALAVAFNLFGKERLSALDRVGIRVPDTERLTRLLARLPVRTQADR